MAPLLLTGESAHGRLNALFPGYMHWLDGIALLLLVCVLLTMPVFAWLGSSRELDPEVLRRSKTFLIGRWVRNWVIWGLGPLERAGVRGRIPPDAFTWAGLLLAAGAGWAFAVGAFSAAAWLVLLSGATDIVDGRIARARRLDSRYGAFLDTALDRYGEVAVFLGLLWYSLAFPPAVVATFLALAGSLLVSYTRAAGESLGIDYDGGVMQRAERMVGVSLAGIFDGAVTGSLGWRPGVFLAGVVAMVAVGSLATAFYRTVWIARQLRSSVSRRPDSCSSPLVSAKEVIVAKKDRPIRKTNKAGSRPGLLSKIGFRSDESDGKGMKATDLLKEDHKRVKELFAKYDDLEGSKATVQRRQIVDELSRELEIHAQLEEKIFYQSFKNARDEEPKKMVRESFEEHKIVKTLLAELSRMEPSDEQYDAKVSVLKESVLHHAEEEEDELFPAAEREFSNEQLEALGSEMEDLKEQIQQSFERPSQSRGRKSSRTAARPPQRPAEA